MPITFDDLSRGHRDLGWFGPLFVGSIQDQSALRAVLAETCPVACLHFAALADVWRSPWWTPARYYRNIVTGSLNLLEALLAANVTRMVFSS